MPLLLFHVCETIITYMHVIHLGQVQVVLAITLCSSAAIILQPFALVDVITLI